MPDESTLASASQTPLEDAYAMFPDNEAQITTLARALRMQRGFGLYFVSIRQADQRRRLLADLRERLPELSIQDVFLREPEQNLLTHLRQTLENLPADASPPLLCVYGMENWLGGVEDVETSAFVGNLNATRNAFPSALNCPLLFCVPEHILVGITRGAPDFFSVRSGVYFLDVPPEPRMMPTFEDLHTTELQAALGMGIERRRQQTTEWEELLNGYRALPPDKRDYLAEASVLDSLSTMHFANGDYDLAAHLLENALSTIRQIFGAEHLASAKIMNNLALLYQHIGNYPLALELFIHVLSINESANVSDDFIACSLNNIAMVYESMSEYSRALSLYERALAISESSTGIEHVNTASSLNNIALLYTRTGDYSRALPLLQRALAIRESSLGPNHPDTATSTDNLAAAYDYVREYSNARPLYERALYVRELALGPNHPDTASSLNSLAVHYERMGEYASALPLLERSLSIRKAMLGNKHPDTATSLNNLARLYDRMGEPIKAIPLLESSLAIREAIFGAEHPDTAVSLNNLGGSYLSIGEYELALPLLERAIPIVNNKLGPDHPTTRMFLANLSFLQKQMQIHQQNQEPTTVSRRQWRGSLFDSSGKLCSPKIQRRKKKRG